MAVGSDYENTDAVAPLDPERASPLCALVSVGGVVTSHELPAEGVLSIGRASTCDLVIDHASVSRRHALLQCGPLAITDLGSRNRVRLRGAHVPPHVATPLEVGEAVQLGEATVLIHPRAELDDAATAWRGPRAADERSFAVQADATGIEAAGAKRRMVGGRANGPGRVATNSADGDMANGAGDTAAYGADGDMANGAGSAMTNGADGDMANGAGSVMTNGADGDMANAAGSAMTNGARHPTVNAAAANGARGTAVNGVDGPIANGAGGAVTNGGSGATVNGARRPTVNGAAANVARRPMGNGPAANDSRATAVSGVDGAAANGVDGAAADGARDGAEPTPMERVQALVAQVAAGELTVLITGETGVGKEVCAERIHRLSPRARGPFVKLNCSAIAESLLESELFGHERGAFTGAATATGGLFEAGDGGTVFLDEIGELPIAAQAKLLRVLEERVVRRVGATASRTLDVRFVCATNRVLVDEVDAGRFRRDLYYRIAGVTIAIPPLRERRDEIDGLARLFAERARPGAVLAPDAIDALMHHDWPGNIRELRNAIERAVLLAGTGAVRAEHLAGTAGPTARGGDARGGDARGGDMRGGDARGGDARGGDARGGDARGGDANASRASRPSWPTLPIPRVDDGVATLDLSLPTEVADLERRRILETLSLCGGNQTRAARALGISRNTLLTRLDSYGLPRPRKT